MKKNLENVSQFSLCHSVFFCLENSRSVNWVNQARSLQKADNTDKTEKSRWNFSRCVFFSLYFVGIFNFAHIFTKNTTKPTNENYFDMDAGEKSTFGVWITNLRQRSSNYLFKLALCTKACRTAVCLFLKITLEVTMVFFGRFTRDFTNRAFLTNEKMVTLIKVIFRNPQASSCHQKLCLGTSNASLQNLCLRFSISQTHRENDFFFEKWTYWYKAFSHNSFFKRKITKLSRFPILISSTDWTFLVSFCVIKGR